MSAGLRLLLGVGWGAIGAIALASLGRRGEVSTRVRGLHPSPAAVFAPQVARRARAAFEVLARLAGPFGRVAGGFARRHAARRADERVARALPVTIDLLGVAVGAGCTPYLAVETVARWAPVDARSRLDGVVRACALGSSFSDALDSMADAAPPLRPLADALLASDRYGAPVGDALTGLATEERAALRRAAETKARKVPVRLLFPLVFLVLPAFGLLTIVPSLMSSLGRT
jgi:pilus assembly protein TadC